MSRKELKDQLEVLENYINDIPNVIDPCSQCKFKDRSIWDNLEKCKECCYYYPSNFKIKKGEQMKEFIELMPTYILSAILCIRKVKGND